MERECCPLVRERRNGMRWFALVYLAAAAITLFLIVQIVRVILELS